MEIIGTTSKGFLIEATSDEVSEILRSVQGSVPESIAIGQKIPAIDYASTITKLKKLPDEYSFKKILSCADSFNEELVKLTDAVNKATDL